MRGVEWLLTEVFLTFERGFEWLLTQGFLTFVSGLEWLLTEGFPTFERGLEWLFLGDIVLSCLRSWMALCLVAFVPSLLYS